MTKRWMFLVAGLGGCGASDDGPTVDVPNPLTDPDDGPGAGISNPRCEIPAEAGLADSSDPDHVVGDGTPRSCTSRAVIDGIAAGGVVTFDCGPDPITIVLDEPAKIVNATGPEIVIDGGGLVTLSGGGRSRILYMNTCDQAQGWTTDHCNDQDHPRLTLQNLTFIDADSRGESEYDGGGAVWVRGGRLKVINSRFFGNRCADDGPDVGGAAIRAFDQYADRPIYVVNSTFGGAEGFGNACANGGAISSIGVSWTVFDTRFSHNTAIGTQDRGGGAGGAIYNDGNTMSLSLCGVEIESNEARAFGSAIFFVSNDHSGDIRIEDSVITGNRGGSWYPAYPQLSHHDDTPVRVIDSVIEAEPPDDAAR